MSKIVKVFSGDGCGTINRKSQPGFQVKLTIEDLAEQLREQGITVTDLIGCKYHKVDEFYDEEGELEQKGSINEK